MIASIREFGFRIPVLARSNGEVVDGHLRLKAAQELGLTELPVILCDEWTQAQVKAFRLMVNRSASWADWDSELVTLEMQELKAINFDLKLTGFELVEIDAFLFAGNSACQPLEQIPNLPCAAVTQLGDRWRCGQHLILCGDCTNRDGVQLLLGHVKPVLMVTDLPYESAGTQVDWTNAWQLFIGDVAYVWHAGACAAEVATGLETAGFQIRAQIIWVKQHFALGHGDYHLQHKPCFYLVREGKSSHWCGDCTQSTVWQTANLNPIGGSGEEANTCNRTQKPIELMRRPILNNTARGEIVYDPFLGSGTTLIAAESTDRICYGLEIDPGYVDVTVKRWQRLTGRQAVLEDDGRTFDELAAVRAQEGSVA